MPDFTIDNRKVCRNGEVNNSKLVLFATPPVCAHLPFSSSPLMVRKPKAHLFQAKTEVVQAGGMVRHALQPPGTINEIDIMARTNTCI